MSRLKSNRNVRGFIAGLLVGATLTTIATPDVDADAMLGGVEHVLEIAFSRGMQTGLFVASVDSLEKAKHYCEAISQMTTTKDEEIMRLLATTDYGMVSALATLMHELTVEGAGRLLASQNLSCDFGWQEP
ncbi:MAG: hypothetical protein OXG05_10600 [Gammaproteobacteria bacterium]|nr:hypothetical protein [Gammaproteobacteria bacterium]